MEARRILGSALILFPAYGRMYDDHASMRKDWEAGKDFRVFAGPYCSIRDIERLKQDASSVYITDPRSRVQIKVA